jgi:hypothetical protein
MPKWIERLFWQVELPGQVVQRLRMSRGLTVPMLSAASGIPDQTLRDLEAGTRARQATRQQVVDALSPTKEEADCILTWRPHRKVKLMPLLVTGGSMTALVVLPIIVLFLMPRPVTITLELKDDAVVRTRPDCTVDLKFHATGLERTGRVRFEIVTDKPYRADRDGIPDPSGNGSHPVLLAARADYKFAHTVHAILYDPASPNVDRARTSVQRVVRANACTEPASRERISGSEEP